VVASCNNEHTYFVSPPYHLHGIGRKLFANKVSGGHDIAKKLMITDLVIVVRVSNCRCVLIEGQKVQSMKHEIMGEDIVSLVKWKEICSVKSGRI
jgi:hypothetical protein